MSDTRDLTTIDAVKTAMQISGGDTSFDDILPGYITQASVAIMEYCKREFAPVVTTTRRFKVDNYRCELSPYDLQSASAVVLHPETSSPYSLVSGQYMLKPINPVRGVYTSIQFSGFLVIISQTLMQFDFALVDITGTWGFPSIPEDVKRATTITVASWLTRSAPGASGQYAIPAMVGVGAQMYRNDWHIPWAAVKLLGEYKRGSARWAF